jgi:hypothetical protein
MEERDRLETDLSEAADLLRARVEAVAAARDGTPAAASA